MTGKLNRLVALAVFAVSGLIYYLTLSTTVVFWDVGEFIAAARLMQVPHPPGAPFFIIVGRVVSLVPFFADIAARMHAISAFSSALTVMFLYLTGVKVINLMKGPPRDAFDRFLTFGSSAVGALTLAVTSTFWDNAIEAEVYGLSMLFVSVIVWLVMRWWEKADEAHNEKYLLLIAYLVGLSVGVHLLAVLAIFPVLMLVYFRLYEVNQKTAIRFTIVALAIFFITYPGVVQLLPSMLDGDATLPLVGDVQSNLLPLIPPLAIVAAAYYAWTSIRRRQRMLHIACLSFLLIVLGYTTYTVVLIRANVPNLPMNENNPKDMAGLTAYLGREQYGDTPLLKGESWDNNLQNFREKMFPRRHSREGMHEATRRNYTSDADFLWRYQTNHMFTRYVLWNFVGQEGSYQDAGVDWSRTYGIPLLVALFGIWYHVRRDWKTGLTFVVMFLTMGVVLALYQNQQDPQPRDRDYFYVGAYYVLALWVSVGLYGLTELIRQNIRADASYRTASAATLAVLALALPINLTRINWHEHDRSRNYVAWDYSYNLLQSCKPNGILFTNGDNDTFPLWYLQDVEGVRRDIRIVNLSLVNTPWYIDQMKNSEPHGAAKVPVGLRDEQIANIMPVQWRPRTLDLPVPADVARRYIDEARSELPASVALDTSVLAAGKISYTLAGYDFRPDIKILRVQDIMVRDIIHAGKWERPIHFAVTVSPDSKVGFDRYLWMQGQSYELKPIPVPSAEAGIDPKLMAANVLARDVVPSKDFQPGFLYRNLNDSGVFYNENTQRMVLNYRAGYMRLADYTAKVEGDPAKAGEIMRTMEATLPLDVIPTLDWRYVVYMMRLSQDFGDTAQMEFYAVRVEQEARGVISRTLPGDRSRSEAYQLVLEVLDSRRDYPGAIELLESMNTEAPNNPETVEIRRRIDYYKALQGAAQPDTNNPG